jgi:hypothetical protein
LRFGLVCSECHPALIHARKTMKETPRIGDWVAWQRSALRGARRLLPVPPTATCDGVFLRRDGVVLDNQGDFRNSIVSFEQRFG